MTKLVMNNMYMRRKSFNILKKKKKNMENKNLFYYYKYADNTI